MRRLRTAPLLHLQRTVVHGYRNSAALTHGHIRRSALDLYSRRIGRLRIGVVLKQKFAFGIVQPRCDFGGLPDLDVGTSAVWHFVVSPEASGPDGIGRIA